MGNLSKPRSFVWLLALLAAVMLVEDADAQRGRRKRRRQPKAEPPPAQVEEAQPAPDAGTEAMPESAMSPDAASGGEPTAEGEGEAVPEAASPEASEGGASGSEDPFDAVFEGPDLGPLREEFTAIMDELVQTRSRISVLGRQLFDTRVRVRLHNRADEVLLARVTISLDGAPVFQQDGSVGGKARGVFDGFAAPGPHLLTVEVEQRARADDSYGYTLRDTYRFEVLKGKATEVLVLLDDDSDIAEDFPDDEEGEYDVRSRIRVATRDLERR